MTADHSPGADATRGGYRRWLIPFGSALALMVGNGSVSIFAFGVFIRPLEAEFGWSRASISAALAFCGLLSALTLPFVGMLMDRFGIRRLLLVAICLFGANLAALGTVGGLLAFTLLTALSGVTGAAQSPIGYVKAVSARFDANRGFAIGVAMSGVGLGTALIPLYAQWLIDLFGWRVAYVGLGAAVVLLAGPVAMLLIPDVPVDAARRPAMTETAPVPPPGMAFRDALFTSTFGRLAVIVLLVSLVVNGSLVHVVPMLIDQHWAPTDAAAIMIVAGVAGMIGRLLVGVLIDRIFAPYVAAACFLLAAVGLVALAAGHYVPAAIFTVGLAAGAEVDLMGFLVSRYFGLRSFGRIYSLLFAIFTFAAGLGPYLFGAGQAAWSTYSAVFAVASLMLVIASGCVLSLGRYTQDAVRA